MADWDDPDDWSEDDWPDESDEELESITVACPSCGAEIYEDAVSCPVCGEYVTHSHSVWEGKPWWWVALGIVGIIAVIVILAAL